MKKKILVLGSNSFSGSHFVNLLLQKNFKVIGISRSKEPIKCYLPYKDSKKLYNFKFYRKDINKNLAEIIQIISKNKIKYIANFASQGMVAESWENPRDWYLTNTLSQISFFQELSKINIKKYLHISTPEIYGSSKKKIYETNAHNPTTPYAISRSAADKHLFGLNKIFKFPVVFARAGNVYGPGQQLYRIIPKIIISIKKNILIPIHGMGKSKRSFVHINDTSDGYFKILINGKIGQCYHISAKNYLSIKKLAMLICKILKNKHSNFLKFLPEDRPGKDMDYFLSSKKIKKELKWKDTIDLYKGIKDTIKWIDDNYKILSKEPMEYRHKQ